jgi:hypothetical protein
MLLLPGVYRRQSKSGLREMFSKNRSTRTLTTTSETEGGLPETNTKSLVAGSHDPSWVPPPLFQAYPQSIRHINLEASTLSAPSIIRMNEQRSATLVHDSVQYTPGVSADSPSANRRPRRASASLAKAEWTRKVYVLTTSGHLLQYSGEGAFDRKPEKILQLGKDSAAFASDAIEGRHFVLHVSQSCSEDGETDLDSSKGIFSRMGIKTATARRSAKVLLMVFETPDDLDSWLSAIRKMIGSLGGRPYSPEGFTVEAESAPQLEVSRRYLVQKNPNQFSEVSSADAIHGAAEERPSTRSSTYTATDLERLRDSKTSNISMMMMGTPTSLLDSPPSSPVQEKFKLTEVPRLELPDLGPSSLVDFSQLGKRQSRLSLMFSDVTRHKSVDVKPTARFSRKASLRAQPAVRHRPSISDTQHSHEQNQDHSNQKMREREQEVADDNADQTNERPISTIAPLPASFSLRHTAPELSSGHRYSHLFSTASDYTSQLPKRFSSLEYSRDYRQSNVPKPVNSQTSSPDKKLRRPTSMQLKSEPQSRPQIPARSPSHRSFGKEGRMSADTVLRPDGLDGQMPVDQSHTGATSTFGPPVGPPPSCPLPAVPTGVASLPLRRQSLAARETVLSESWSEGAPEFF